MLVASIFSFSHNVLKRLLSQTRQKVSLCENVLIHFHPTLYLNILEGEGLNHQPKRKLGENGKRRQPASFRSPILFSPFSKYMNNNSWTISCVSTKASTLDESKMSVLQKFVFLFLDYLSTKCSLCAFVIAECPMSGVRRPSSTISLNIFSS